jgi:hypothetical protein
MSKKSINSKGGNHKANINNANKGTKDTNIIWDKAQGNRGKQMQPKTNYLSSKGNTKK